MWCSKNLEKKLAEKAKRLTIKNIDIVYLIARFHELERLKQLFFNPLQIEALELVDKPLIKSEQYSHKPSYSNTIRTEKKSYKSKTPARTGTLYEDEQKPQQAAEEFHFNSHYHKLYLAYQHLRKDDDRLIWFIIESF